MSVDTLSLARELRAAEIEPLQAEAIAAAIGRAVVETAATKADLNQSTGLLRGELKQSDAGLRGELRQVEAGLRAEIQSVSVRVDAVDLRLGGRLDTVASDLRGEIEKSKTFLLFWFIGTQLAVGGLVVALIKLLPSQG